MGDEKKFGGLLHETRPGANGIGDAPSVSPTYGHVLANKGYSAPADKCKNLFEVFDASVKLYGDRPCLGKRINGKGEFVWETYKVRAAERLQLPETL